MELSGARPGQETPPHPYDGPVPDSRRSGTDDTGQSHVAGAAGRRHRAGARHHGRARLDRIEPALSPGAPTRFGTLGPADLDRHPARRRRGRIREPARPHALDRPSGAGGGALRRGPRPQRRHPALAREHADGSLSFRARGPRQQRLPRPEGHEDARRPAEAARLPQRRLRERVRTRRALRARERLRPLGLARGGRGVEPRLRDPGAPGALDRGRGRTLARGRQRPELRLRPPLRAPRALRAAARLRLGRAFPLPRRGRGRRRRARAVARSAARAGPERADARDPDLRPRRVARRARRGDPRRLRVRGHAARAARGLRAGAFPAAGRRTARSPRGPRPHRARRLGDGDPDGPAGEEPASPASRRSRPRSTVAGRLSTGCATGRSSTSSCRCRSSTTSARTPARRAIWPPRDRRTWSASAGGSGRCARRTAAFRP